MTLQLPLGIHLPVFKRFDSYVIADNQFLIDMLCALANKGGEQQLFIWGQSGVGKTHLLQSVCDLASQSGYKVTYIPLANFIDMTVEVLSGLESLDIVCVDDCELVYGKENWEIALFNLINASRELQTRLLFASQANPVHAQMILPDLQSRLQWGPVVHLQGLDDENKRQFLQQRSESKGLHMDDKTANYILQHCQRDMESLSNLLDKLDVASLAASRGLSIPFIKSVIEES